MHIPRKNHPIGKEFHTIWDGEFDLGIPVLWHTDIQEGKDCLAELGPKKYDVEGKMVGLMRQMIELIKFSGKCVTMASGFVV